jgi:hypothetical protein
MPSSAASWTFSLLYVVAGSVVLSVWSASAREGAGSGPSVPLRDMSVMAGDASRLKLDDESPRRLWGGRGETSVVVGSEKMSEGVSISGVYVGRSWGGKAGRLLSTLGAGPGGGFLDFLRRRAISDSWQDMQKIPCDVRA